MKNKATFLFLFLACSLLWLGCSKETVDPNFTGSIEGQVQNSTNGQGIPSVSITTSPGTDAILTDANGQFTLSDIPTGNYTITARKDSFITSTTRVAVNENRVTNAQIPLTPDDDNGSTNGNVNAEVTFVDTIMFNSVSGADSNFVDVEYMVENISGSNRVGNYEVYFDIFTSGTTFNQEIRGDSLAIGERTFGTFTKYIREFEADSVTISGIFTPNNG